MRPFTRITDFLLAAVLFAAVIGKVAFLPVEHRLGLFSYRPVLGGIILLEIAAAAWFVWLSPVYPSITRALGIVLFASLGLYSLFAWLRGESCQCFGAAGISPLVALTIDVFAIAHLFLRSSAREANAVIQASLRWCGFAVSCSAMSVPSVVFAIQHVPSELSRAGEILGSSKTVLLEPERWLDQRFPLLSYVDFPANLARGDWLVVLYRPDCSHCQQLIPELTERYSEGADAIENVPGLAFIDVSSNTDVEWRSPGRIAFGRLSSDWEWFLTPPVILGLRNGRVNDIRTDHSIKKNKMASRPEFASSAKSIPAKREGALPL